MKVGIVTQMVREFFGSPLCLAEPKSPVPVIYWPDGFGNGAGKWVGSAKDFVVEDDFVTADVDLYEAVPEGVEFIAEIDGDAMPLCVDVGKLNPPIIGTTWKGIGGDHMKDAEDPLAALERAAKEYSKAIQRKEIADLCAEQEAKRLRERERRASETNRQCPSSVRVGLEVFTWAEHSDGGILSIVWNGKLEQESWFNNNDAPLISRLFMALRMTMWGKGP